MSSATGSATRARAKPTRCHTLVVAPAAPTDGGRRPLSMIPSRPGLNQAARPVHFPLRREPIGKLVTGREAAMCGDQVGGFRYHLMALLGRVHSGDSRRRQVHSIAHGGQFPETLHRLNAGSIPGGRLSAFTRKGIRVFARKITCFAVVPKAPPGRMRRVGSHRHRRGS